MNPRKICRFESKEIANIAWCGRRDGGMIFNPKDCEVAPLIMALSFSQRLKWKEFSPEVVLLIN